MKKFPRPHTRQMFKGIVSKLTIKFCQKCGKMKDRQKKKMTTITNTLDMIIITK